MPATPALSEIERLLGYGFTAGGWHLYIVINRYDEESNPENRQDRNPPDDRPCALQACLDPRCQSMVAGYPASSPGHVSLLRELARISSALVHLTISISPSHPSHRLRSPMSILSPCVSLFPVRLHNRPPAMPNRFTAGLLHHPSPLPELILCMHQQITTLAQHHSTRVST